ncbi:MAG: rRNA maturation RNase YbeY [Candidatus Yonathbacteria bacterium]|nr:rRNA maturation RNase YbeY [Candidatus Yonathbacteria bacterium]
MNDSFDIRNTTRQATPHTAGSLLRAIKKDILGDDFRLSMVFIGDTLSRRLNREYRGKDKDANVLSFPLSKDAGEIFINLHRAKKDAHRFEKGYNEFVIYLFVHGCLHLKGYDHGPAMERAEDAAMAKFFEKKK